MRQPRHAVETQSISGVQSQEDLQMALFMSQGRQTQGEKIRLHKIAARHLFKSLFNLRTREVEYAFFCIHLRYWVKEVIPDTKDSSYTHDLKEKMFK